MYTYVIRSETQKSFKVSHFCFTKHLKNGWIGVFQEWRQAGFGYPGRLGDVLLPLGCEVGRVGVEHVVPPGVLQMPYIVPEVAVVGHANQFPQFQLVHPRLLLHFPEGCHGYILASLLMPLGQVPEAVAVNQQKVAPAVGDKASGGIDLSEFRAQAPVGPVHISRGDVDSCNRIRCLEHFHQGPYIDSLPYVEFY